MQAHCVHIIDSAYLIRLGDIVHQLLSEAILDKLLIDCYRPVALEHVKFKTFPGSHLAVSLQNGVPFLAQKEGDIRILVFGLNEFDGGLEQLVKVGYPDDRLTEIRYKTYDAELFDKVSLGLYKVVAENIDFLVLLFAILVQPLYQQAQPSMSLFIVHHPSLLDRTMKLTALPGFSNFGLIKVQLNGANQDLIIPYD